MSIESYPDKSIGNTDFEKTGDQTDTPIQVTGDQPAGKEAFYFPLTRRTIVADSLEEAVAIYKQDEADNNK